MKQNGNTNVQALCTAAVIAAVYVILTLAFAPISFGPIQFRISEMLCVLPAFTAAGIPGVAIGCLLANMLGGAAMPDIVFGSLATLLGAIGTYLLCRNAKKSTAAGGARQSVSDSGAGLDCTAARAQADADGWAGTSARTEAGTADLNGAATSVEQAQMSELSLTVRAALPPVISNAIIIPLVLKYAYHLGDAVWFMVLTVGAGEVLAVGVLGGILIRVLKRYRSVLFAHQMA